MDSIKALWNLVSVQYVKDQKLVIIVVHEFPKVK